MKKFMVCVMSICAMMMLSVVTALAQTQATPDMKGQPGPFPAGTDFYYVTAVDGGEGVSLFAGNLSKFREEVKINLVLDVSKCESSKQGWFFWNELKENDMDEKQMDKIKKWILNEFQDEFTRKNKTGLKLAEPKNPVEDAPYELVIRLRKMNTGNDSGFWVSDTSMKQGGAVVDGTVELVDTKTGEIYSVFAFNRMKSMFGLSQRERVGDVMGTVGKQVRKIVTEQLGK